MRTQVGIVGAGPAGLLLSHLLHLRASTRSCWKPSTASYVEQRVRAGVLEQRHASSCSRGRRRRAARPRGAAAPRHRAAVRRRAATASTSRRSTGRSITVYGQQEVVKDLIAARLAAGGDDPCSRSPTWRLHDLDTDRPRRFVPPRRASGRSTATSSPAATASTACAGRRSRRRTDDFERDYPFAWLGILAEAAPTPDELIYARHDRGFALHSMRSPDDHAGSTSRSPPDERHRRLAGRADLGRAADPPGDGRRLRAERRGRSSRRASPRCAASSPSRCATAACYLAGDAAHIVPPTGAKGMNLADRRRPACWPRRSTAFYATGGTERARREYSATCLRRVWRAQHFSWWMTTMLHRFERRPVPAAAAALRAATT